MKTYSTRFASDFVLDEGIWRSVSKKSIPYPDMGRDIYYKIEDQSFWFHHRMKCVQIMMERFDVQGVFLDVGGGNGFMTKCLQDTRTDTILVEPGWNGCLNAKERGVKQIICASIEELSFPDEKPDAVGLFDVLEHVQDEIFFLSSIHKALPQRGRLLLTVPAYPWLWSADDESASHCRRYSLNSLSSVLRSAGFSILFVSHIFFCLLAPVFLFKRLPYLAGFRDKELKMESIKKLHSPSPAVQFILNTFLKAEQNMLRNKTVPFGTSIMALAQKD